MKGYEFWDYYEPARHVGGDYYGFIPLFDPQDTRRVDARRWAIAVGDVVGKGLPAALLTARLSAEIRLFLQGETDPARVVTRLNLQLTENGVLDMYITFLLAMLDVSSHRLMIVNAGHPYPLIRRKDGRLEEFAPEASGSAPGDPGRLGLRNHRDDPRAGRRRHPLHRRRDRRTQPAERAVRRPDAPQALPRGARGADGRG